MSILNTAHVDERERRVRGQVLRVGHEYVLEMLRDRVRAPVDLEGCCGRRLLVARELCGAVQEGPCMDSNISMTLL